MSIARAGLIRGLKSTNFGGSEVDMVCNGDVYLTYPIFALPNSNTGTLAGTLGADAETTANWRAIHQSLDRDNTVVYKPAVVYDNLNAAGGLHMQDPLSKNPPAEDEWFYPNTYNINLTPRSLNPCNGPLLMATAPYSEYCITGIEIEYNPIGVLNESSHIMIQIFEDGLQTYYPTAMQTNFDSITLNITNPRVSIPIRNPRWCKNQEVVTLRGEDDSMKSAHRGWDPKYDSLSIRAILLNSNNVGSVEMASIISSLGIRMHLQCRKLMMSKAMALFPVWKASGYAITAGGGGGGGQVVGFGGGRVDIVQHTATSNSRAQRTPTVSSKKGKNTLLYNSRLKMGIDQEMTHDAHKDRIGYTRMLKNLERQVGSDLYTRIKAGTVVDIAGVSGGALEPSLVHRDPYAWIEDLYALFPTDGTAPVCRNGTYFIATNADGANPYTDDIYNMEQKFAQAPACGSLMAVLQTESGTTPTGAGGIVPGPFVLRDSVYLKDSSGRDVYDNTGTFSIFTPITGNLTSNAFDSQFVENILVSTFGISSPFKDTLEASTLSSGWDYSGTERVTTVEVETNDMPTTHRCVLQKNSIVVEIPKEIKESPVITKQYVDLRRNVFPTAVQNGFIDWIVSHGKAIVGGISKVAGVVANILPGQQGLGATAYGKTNIAGMSLGSVRLQSKQKKTALGADPENQYISFEDGNAVCFAHGTHRSTVGQDDVMPELKTLFPDYASAAKYSVTPPADPSDSVYVAVNGKLEIIPAITVGVSNPITYTADKDITGNWIPTQLKGDENAFATVAKNILVGKVVVDKYPTLCASRWPMDDPKSLKNCIFLTDPVKEFSQVQFSTNDQNGKYKNIDMKLTNAQEVGVLHMNTVTLNLANTIDMHTGFFIPDKLPNENGQLVNLDEGEKFYVFLVIRIRTAYQMNEGWLSEARKATGISIYSEFGPIHTNEVAVPKTRDMLNSQIGCVFTVMAGNKRVLMSDGDSVDDAANKLWVVRSTNFSSSTVHNGIETPV